MPAYGTQTFRVWDGVLNTATGHTIYLNGAQVASNGNTTPFNGAASGVVGRGFGGGRYYNGDLAEILIYPSALSPAARQSVEQYLNYKWFGMTPPGYGTGLLPATTDVQISAGATLDLNGLAQNVASLADGTGAGSVVNSAATTPVSLTVNPASGNYTFTGTISDAGAANALSVTKTGAGTQTLAGSNIVYTGPTLASDGTLVLRDAVNFASAITDNATVQFDVTTGVTHTYSQPIGGTGSVVKTADGVLALAGSNSYGGSTTVNGGTLLVNGDQSAATGAVTVGNNGAPGRHGHRGRCGHGPERRGPQPRSGRRGAGQHRNPDRQQLGHVR